MKIENEKDIDVPPSVVWSVTEDIERWPKWTPTVTAVRRLDEGPFDVGSTALLKQPGLPQATWRVTALTRGKGFTWETRIGAIRFVGTHELEPAGTGTRSKLCVEVSGIGAVLLWPLMRNAVRKSLERENAGLKAECELVATRVGD